MNIEDLTIKQAREIAAMFGTAVNSDPVDDPIGSMNLGKTVLVRSRGSGVWVGRLLCRHNGGTTVELTEARRVWSWTGAAECSALSVNGPISGKIGVKCAVIVHGVCEEHAVQPAAIVRFDSIEEWAA